MKCISAAYTLLHCNAWAIYIRQKLEIYEIFDYMPIKPKTGFLCNYLKNFEP